MKKVAILGYSAGREPIYGRSIYDNVVGHWDSATGKDSQITEEITAEKWAEYLRSLAPKLSDSTIDEIIKVQTDIPEVIEVLNAEKERRLEEMKTDFVKWCEYYFPNNHFPDEFFQKKSTEQIKDFQKTVEAIQAAGINSEAIQELGRMIKESFSKFQKYDFNELSELFKRASESMIELSKLSIQIKYDEKPSVNPNDRKYKNRRKW